MHTQNIYRRRRWHPTPVLLPGKSHGQRSLVSCSPWGHKELDTTERLHFHFSLSCIGEGNGNPLQCSCMENPRDGEPGGLQSMGLHRGNLAVADANKRRRGRSSLSQFTLNYLIFFFEMQKMRSADKSEGQPRSMESGEE